MQHSEKIGELAAALAKARTSFGAIVKDKSNPAFPRSKYADLENVIGATFKALSENGLAIVQSPGSYSPETHCARLTTTLLHASGEWITDTMEMPVGKVDSWGVGSACTYARRYSYQAFVNVAAEPDDDGTASREEEKAEIRKPQALRTTDTTIAPQKTLTQDRRQDPTAEEAYTKAASEYNKTASFKVADEMPANDPQRENRAPWAGGEKTEAKGEYISDGQRKRMWAIAKDRGMEKSAVKNIYGRYGAEDDFHIPWKCYKDIMAQIETYVHAVAQ